jgi:phosphate-selective porin OprO/OprP
LLINFASVAEFPTHRLSKTTEKTKGYMMKNHYKIYAGLLLASVSFTAFSTPALADQRDDRIRALEQKLDALIGEIRALKKDQASDKADKETLSNQVIDLKRGQAAALAEVQIQKAATPQLGFANGRPTFTSADGKNAISIRSLLQYDVAHLSQNGRSASGTDLNSGSNFRRARIGVDGKIAGDWSFSFLYDLGGSGNEAASLSDAYIQYDGLGPVHLRTGAFATPQGIEDQTSASDLIFLERAASSDLARSIAGSDGRKNFLSVFANGDDYYAAATWSAARSFDPAVFDSQQAAVGRLAYRLYKDADTNVIVSASGSYVFKIADSAASPAGASAITFQNRLESTVDGTRLISTGAINARRAAVWGVETAGNWKNLYGQAGYFGYSISRRASTLPSPSFDGWYVQGTWLLTGESRRYNTASASYQSPRPASPYDFKGKGIGAWELTARYSVLDLDYRPGIAGAAVVAATGGIRGGRQEGFTGGINWYPNSVLRFLVNYTHHDIDRLATVAPFQNIGQTVDIITARAQLAF